MSPGAGAARALLGRVVRALEPDVHRADELVDARVDPCGLLARETLLGAPARHDADGDAGGADTGDRIGGSRCELELRRIASPRWRRLAAIPAGRRVKTRRVRSSDGGLGTFPRPPSPFV
jgi:hypothetical protein